MINVKHHARREIHVYALLLSFSWYVLKIILCFPPGDPLATMSAMKMEMVVNAPISGVVKAVHIEKGMKLAGEDLIMEIE